MIPIAEPLLGREELKSVIRVIKSGWISSQGEYVKKFEEQCAHYCGKKYGVSTSSGTAALHLALAALGIGEGDDVIVPSLTFVATANAVRYTGAEPVFVDSHQEYWCINPEKIEDKITKRTKLIIPVHLYGHPCDMDPIFDIARRNNLLVVEDAAEAHGAEYRGRKIGSFGDISCFSFYGNKIITTGEGGMCLTNNKELYKRMRILRDHGMTPKKRYWYDVIGFNYRMTNLQAALGVAQLKSIDKFIDKKRKVANWYANGLKDLEKKGLVTLHPERPWAKCVYWMYSILIEDAFGINRDTVARALQENGIETRPFFYPLHILPPYRRKKEKPLPASEALGRNGLCLPSSVKLKKKTVEIICAALRNLTE